MTTHVETRDNAGKPKMDSRRTWDVKMTTYMNLNLGSCRTCKGYNHWLPMQDKSIAIRKSFFSLGHIWKGHKCLAFHSTFLHQPHIKSAEENYDNITSSHWIIILNSYPPTWIQLKLCPWKVMIPFELFSLLMVGLSTIHVGGKGFIVRKRRGES